MLLFKIHIQIQIKSLFTNPSSHLPLMELSHNICNTQ